MAQKLTPAQIESALAGLTGWTYDGQRAIARDFEFPDHIAAFGFLTRVAMAAESMDHHPEVEMVYNKVKLTLSTHSAGGVTQLDIDLATTADRYV